MQIAMSSQAVEASALLSTAGVTCQYYVASIICCGFLVDLLELLDTAIPLIFQQAPIFVQLCASYGHTSFRNSHLELQMSLQHGCVLLLLVLLDVAHCVILAFNVCTLSAAPRTDWRRTG
jgi:hypothetical protein